MRTKQRVIVAKRGEYDITDERTNQQRQYPWAELLDLSDGGVFRATLAEGYTPNGELEVGATVEADLELFADRGGKLKLRLHGATKAARAAA